MSSTKDLEERLIEEARRVGRHRTRKEAIVAALREYIRRHAQTEAAEQFGSFDLTGGGTGPRKEKSR